MVRVTVKCPSCGAQLSVPDRATRFLCPSCRGGVRIDQDGTAHPVPVGEVKNARKNTVVNVYKDDSQMAAWEVLLITGWFIAIVGSFMSVVLGLAAVDADAKETQSTDHVMYFGYALAFPLAGLVNHVFCRLCQHVQEIRDEIKKISMRDR